MAPQNKFFAASGNTDYLWKSLTDGSVQKMSNGRIPKMTPQQAAGLIGSWIVETGRNGLDRLDVVEKGSAKGRGLSQYTGVRRTPYDMAVSAAKARGDDVNSAQWQLKYFVEEYVGKHDKNGNSLIGWTRVFEQAPKDGTPQTFANYFTGSAAANKGYFRPSIPHTDRRQAAAQEVFQHYYQTPQVKSLAVPKKPNPESTRSLTINKPNPFGQIGEAVKAGLGQLF